MTSSDPRLDKFTGAAREFVSEVGAFALETNDDIDRGTLDCGKWAKSMLKLWDRGLDATLDVAPDMFAPCVPGVHPSGDLPDQSEYIPVEERPVSRKAELVGDLVHDGDPRFRIPPRLVYVDPPILPPRATRFRISVLWPGLRSGTYRGAVKLTPEVDSNVVIDEVITVIIDL